MESGEDGGSSANESKGTENKRGVKKKNEGKGVVPVAGRVSREKEVVYCISVRLLLCLNLHLSLGFLYVDPPARILRSRQSSDANRGRSTREACTQACSGDYGRA